VSGPGRLLAPRVVALALGLCALGGVLALQLRPTPSVAAAPLRHALRFAPPAGSRHLYAVRWDAASRRTLFGGNDQGDVAGGALFDGNLSVGSLGPDAEGLTTLVFRIEHIGDYQVRLGQNDLLDEGNRTLTIASLVGQEVFVRVDERGVFRSMAYRRETAASVRQQLRQLVQMMRVTLPGDPSPTWTAQEPTSNGLAHVRYEDLGDAVERLRVSYEGIAGLVGEGETDQHLSSKAKIRLDPGGMPRSIEDREDFETHGPAGALISKWTFAATATGTDTFEAQGAPPADQLDEGTGAAQMDRERRRRQDERLSRDWNLGTIELELLALGKGQKVEPTFTARAGAFVRLHPDAAAHLVAWFLDPHMNDTGRVFTFDVLSNAGSDEAQDAMRQGLVATAPELGAPVRAALIQRFVFVSQPNPDSARFVAGYYDRARAAGDAQVAAAAAVTLGAVVEHLEEHEQSSLALELDRKLRHDLAERRSPLETVALLRALGNAHEPEDLRAVLEFEHDPQADTREQVARSIRRFDDPVATTALLELADDESVAVQRASFRGLREQSMGDEDWGALDALVEDGRTSAYADTDLVDLLERRPDAQPNRDRMLRFLLGRISSTSGTMELRERVQDLLREGDDAAVTGAP
jgi:hypothetical protein